MTLSITGKSTVSASLITAFIKKNNPKFDSTISEAYILVGATYGIRGDVAICQAIIETGWFKFDGGTAVTPDQYNYCGMGVTSKGMKGNSFNSIKEGVTAHIQHLLAYANKDALPKGKKLVDPRFKYVTRGSAGDAWEGLSMKWAMNANYGKDILRIYTSLLDIHSTAVFEAENQSKKETPKAVYGVEVSQPMNLKEVNEFIGKLGESEVIDVKVNNDRENFFYTIIHKTKKNN